MSVSAASLVELATRRFRQAASTFQQENALTSSSAIDDYNTRCFNAETARINREIEQKRAEPSSAFFPALYLRARDPAGDETTRLLRSTCKAFELDLRFKEIEKLDEMHAKLWTLLNVNDRRSVTLEEYEQLLQDFNAWASEQYGAQLPPPPSAVWEVSSNEEPNDDEGGAERPEPRSSPTSISPDRPHAGLKSPSISAVRNSLDGASGLAGRSSGSGGGSNSARSRSWSIAAQHIQSFRERRRHNAESAASTTTTTAATPHNSVDFERDLRLAEDQPALGNVLYLCSVAPPRPDLQLFLSCPRNADRAVDIAVIYQTFAKQVSLVKCEAELIMWDNNNDGRLSEDEVENYVKDLAPRIAALTTMSKDMLPFYCCTVSRRLFWDLDPGNRGVLRIHSLLQSAVMNEWVSLQLMSEDDPQNWFGAAVTQQLYNKFVMLDTRNKGTLNVENLRCYKKGLPTVIDDGLPLETSPLCSLFIDRYFETNTLMTRSEMDYRKFVDFVIAVELLPQCSRPHFFWNILDMDGTGVVTPMIVNQFFRETHAKLVAAGLDVPSRETVVQEVFDLIEKAEPLRITRDEFVRSPQAGLFMGLLIDCLSFWTYENREQR